MSSYSNQITTLLLDSSFMPYTFLTGRATFLHLIKNNIKCFDASENLIDNNLQWICNQGIDFHEDQPFLTSKDRIWFLPTTAVIKASFYSKRKRLPRTLSLQKLCTIFDYTCQICYDQFDKKDMTVEHIFPRSKGGTKEIENITLTCTACNQRKKDLYPFLDNKNCDIKSVPMPIPLLPNKPVKSRKEWQKYFIYKKYERI
jgi:5-methylcytosine-specific restriction endonuclease McrA